MALRLDVVAGELNNTRYYAVRGWVQVRGMERPIHLELTGNCDADLRGRHICFHARDESDTAPAEMPRLHDPQVGATGTLTAARVAFDRPIDEVLALPRDERAAELKPCLYLEWFSQNGRVVVELADPVIEVVEATEFDTRDGDPLRLDEDGDFAGPTDGTGDDDEDPYGLFPVGLNEQWEAEAEAIDRSLQDNEEESGLEVHVIRNDDEEEVAPDLAEMILMDECIENGPGELIATLVGGADRLARPEDLDDAAVETALQALLGQLALFGISVSLCEHFTPRDCYRLLIDEIVPRHHAYPELRGTSWVQGFTTAEFCKECDAEFEREYEEMQRRRAESGEPPDDIGEEDIPF